MGLRFTLNWQAVETSNLAKNNTSNYGSKFEVQSSIVKVTGNNNLKNHYHHFLCISSWKVDHITSDKDENDHQAILHILSKTHH